jgi:hypothetical protein
MPLLVLRRAVLAVGLGALVSGCPDGPADPPDSSHACTLTFLGDKTKPPEIELTARGPDGIAVPVKDGDTVSMIFPPQGGRVMFAGVRATNIDPCAAMLTGALQDLSTMQLRLDARTINLLPTSGMSGWGGSDDDDISTFSNVPLCPNQWSKTDIYGTTYELSVTVTDREKRTATKTAKVIPSCAEPSNLDECLCICQGGYVLGQHCDPVVDAGADGNEMEGGT